MTVMVRGGKLNTRWLLLAAFLILGILSHAAVAQGPTEVPTVSPTIEPDSTDAPTTESPTVEAVPTRSPTEEPTVEAVRTRSPSEEPSEEPTDSPNDDQVTAPDTEPPTEAPTQATDQETDSPTDTVETDSPTESPSTSPSEPESSAPSSAPSEEPSPIPSVDTEGPVSVIVMPLSEPMSTSNSQHFENTAETFLSTYLNNFEQPIYNVSVTITDERMLNRRQVRRLQESSIQVDMMVAGTFDPVDGMAQTAADYNISQISEQLFNAQGDQFVEMLKDTGNADDKAFFAPVNSVVSASANAPVAAPVDQPPADTGGLSVGVIVAIALVGALVASLVAVFVYKKTHAPNDNGRTESNSSGRQNASSARQSEATSKKLREASGASARPGKNSLLDEASPPVKAIGGPAPVVLTRVDSDVQSDLQSGWGAEESMLGMESNMSYAYSLEDGINATMSDYSEVNYPVPSVIARTSTFESDRNDENDLLDIDKPFEPNSQTILREITAPPGKLGLVLTTSDRGPVVQQVTAGSPLEGMVWPGDVIVSIDGIKTKNMSADQMTQYMTTNLFKKRKLTVLSDGKA